MDSDHDLGGKPMEPHRRAFVIGVTRKVAYVAPMVLALKAAQRVEAGGASCGTAGSPCTENADCCTGLNCLTGGMACNGMLMGCMCA